MKRFHHLIYDMTNLAMRNQEAVVYADSSFEAEIILKKYLSETLDTYPRKDPNVRETDPSRLGFAVKSANVIRMGPSRVISPLLLLGLEDKVSQEPVAGKATVK